MNNTMIRNTTLLIVLSTTLLSLGCQSRPSTTRPPNVIFILSDDLGYGEIGSFGQKLAQTPNLDQMAREGMRLTQFYAGSTVCAPSRCTLMTGLHTGHCFIRGNAPVNLRPQDQTVADLFHQSGYATSLIGKWGLGEEGSTGVPNRKGFDYFYGYLDQVHAHNPYTSFLYRNEQRVSLNNILAPATQPTRAAERGAGHAIKKIDYAPDLFAAEALHWIDSNKNRPFLLYLSLNVPHANNEATKATGDGQEVPDYGIYKDKPWSNPDKGHAAMITRMDSDIGRVFSLLKKLNLDDNTLVIFTSDNGPHKEGGNSLPLFNPSGPLRGIKRDMYEGGIRVPTLVRWPGHVQPNTTSDHIAYFGDFFATTCDLLGRSTPSNLDSISFLPTLLGHPDQQKQHDYLYWEFHENGFSQAVRIGDYKAVRVGRRDAPIEIYDLSTDLGEKTNLAAQNPQLVSRAQDLFQSARTDAPEWPVKDRPLTPTTRRARARAAQP